MPTLIRAKVLQAILLLLLLLQVAHRAASAQGDRQEMMDELSDLSCALDSNETLKLAFYNSVRRRYGDSGNPDNDGRSGIAIIIACVTPVLQICTARFDWAWQATFVAMEAVRVQRC